MASRWVNQRTGAVVTAEELLAMPDDGRRRELIQGKVVEMAPAGMEHGEAEANLQGFLWLWCREHGTGRVYPADAGIRIARDPDTVLVPDTSFYTRGRLPGRSPRGFADVVPELVVEIVSPHDTSRGVNAKVQMWLDAGVEVVWVVWPETRCVTVHRRNARAQTVAEGNLLTEPDLLPGFEVRVADIFG